MDDATKDAVMSLYPSAVVAADYQLTPEDAQDFSSRAHGRCVHPLLCSSNLSLSRP